MPEEAYWASFFSPEAILDRLLAIQGGGNIVEFGCGYGTFTLPAAQRTTGQITALDIEPDMVALVQERARAAGIRNIRASLRDFVEHGVTAEFGNNRTLILCHVPATVS